MQYFPSLALCLLLALPAAAQTPGSIRLTDSGDCDPVPWGLSASPHGFLASWFEFGPRASIRSSAVRLFDDEGAALSESFTAPNQLLNTVLRGDGSGILVERLTGETLTVRFFNRDFHIVEIIELPDQDFFGITAAPDGTFLLTLRDDARVLRLDENGLRDGFRLNRPFADEPGSFLLVVGDELWHVYSGDSAGAATLTAQRYTLAGSPLGSPVTLTGPIAPADLIRLSLTADGRDRLHIAWPAEGGRVIRLQRASADGPLGEPVEVARRDAPDLLDDPGLTADAEGNLLVTFVDRTSMTDLYQDLPAAIYARSVLADGSFAGPERLVVGPRDDQDDRAFDPANAVLVSAGLTQLGYGIRNPVDSFFEPPCETRPAVLTTPVRLAGDRHLLLRDGRFRVEVDWQDPFNGGEGIGHAVPGTEDAGSFWFFQPDTKEIEVKVLDGRTINGSFWVFAAGLSNVGYRITVTDQRTGLSKTYVNPPREYGNFIDTTSFPG